MTSQAPYANTANTRLSNIQSLSSQSKPSFYFHETLGSVPAQKYAEKWSDCLIQSVYTGKFSLMCHSIQNGADINCKDILNRSILTIAASQGHVKCLEYLLQLDNIEIFTKNMQDLKIIKIPALDNAIQSNNEHCVKLLIDAIVNRLEVKNSKNNNNNYISSHTNNQKMFNNCNENYCNIYDIKRYLLSQKGIIRQFLIQVTTLNRKNKKKIVKKKIQRQNVNSFCNKLKNLYNKFLSLKKIIPFYYFTKKILIIDTQPKDKIQHTLERVIEQYTTEKDNAQLHNNNTTSLIWLPHSKCQNHNKKPLYYTYYDYNNNDINFNIMNNYTNNHINQHKHYTLPIHIAAKRGQLKCLEILLQAPYSFIGGINTYDEKQMTPLMHLVKNNHINCALLLLKHSTIQTFSQHDSFGNSILTYAAQHQDPQWLWMLLISLYQNCHNNIIDHNLFLNTTNFQTIQIIAAKRGNYLILRLLRLYFPHINNLLINKKCMNDKTALMWAVIHGHSQCVKELLAVDNNVCSKSYHYLIPYDKLLRIDKLILSSPLKQKQQQIGYFEPRGLVLSQSPLSKSFPIELLPSLTLSSFIIPNSSFPITRPDLTVTDKSGLSALHYTILYNKISCLETLLAIDKNNSSGILTQQSVHLGRNVLMLALSIKSVAKCLCYSCFEQRFKIIELLFQQKNILPCLYQLDQYKHSVLDYAIDFIDQYNKQQMISHHNGAKNVHDGDGGGGPTNQSLNNKSLITFPNDILELILTRLINDSD